MKLKQKALVGVALLLTVGTTLAGCGKGEEQSYKYIPGPSEQHGTKLRRFE